MGAESCVGCLCPGVVCSVYAYDGAAAEGYEGFGGGEEGEVDRFNGINSRLMYFMSHIQTLREMLRIASSVN